MQAAGLLTLHDQQERRNASFPGTERVATAHTVRFVDTTGGRSFILASSLQGLSAAALDRVIAAEIAYFGARGAAFEWKVYSHDAPPDLCDRLAAHGFAVGEAETLLMCELDAAPARLFADRGHPVERLTDPAQVDGVAAVEDAIWGAGEHGSAAPLRRALADASDSLSVFLVRAEGLPAGAARVTYTPGSDFASLWGGGVLPDYRGRGIYGALLAARANEARQRGRRILTIDAGPLSRPIVESLGFIPVASTWPCTVA